MALTAANLYSINTAQDQQFSLHTNTQASANAWDGVELFRLYLQGLPSTDLATLALGTVAITGVSNLAASVVSNVASGSGQRITANITGTGAGSSVTVQVVYSVVPTGSGASTPVVPTLGVININSNLKLSGSINVIGGTAAKLWVNGNVDLTGSVTGIDQICSTGDVTIGSAITVNRICTDGNLTLDGNASVITVEAVKNVVLSGGSVDIATLTSNGNVTLSGGSAKVGTLNAWGTVKVSGGGATVTSVVNSMDAVSWTSSSPAKTINANGNVNYTASNSNTVINSGGSVILSGNGDVKDINALGDVFLKSSYGKGVQGTLLGGGGLTYDTNIKAASGKVKNAISGSPVPSWAPAMNVTQDAGLVVNVPPVSVAKIAPILIPSSTVDVYALKASANYVFDIEAGTGYKQVTVSKVAGITDGTYYLGDYDYSSSLPTLARGNKDYLCTAVNASGKCTAPTEPYQTLCQGTSEYNGCFTYNSTTKKWAIDGVTMAPGFAWFEGDLNVGNGTYINTFASSGSISTSGSAKVYAPNYHGYSAVCSQTSTPGNIRGSRLSGLVPTDVCNTTANTYAANAIGNVALVAGGFVGGVFQGGDITLGSSNSVYGGVIAGNLLKTGGSTTIYGSVQVASQGSSSSGSAQTTTWTGSTTIDLSNTSNTYTPGAQPCMVNCASSGGAASTQVFWTRYL